MPLVSIVGELDRARQERRAIPLFDTSDDHATEGMVAAFEAAMSPGIIGLYAGMLDRPNARAIAAYIRARAEDSSVPLSLMLDHGRSVEDCEKAIDFGFTDVMIDGSKRPFEENIEQTRSVVRMAHERGIGVEAELGQVGSGREYRSFGGVGKGFTDPDIVAEFVRETGIDCLAVAIGTAHGVYEGEPRIDLDLLAEIRSRVDLPLVLHGGSGCTEEQFRAAVAGGIAKVNVATDLFLAAGRRMVERAASADASYWGLSKTAVETFRERSAYYIGLFHPE